MVAIEDIYDAAFDRVLFPGLVAQLVRAFGAQSGFFAWSDMESGGGFEAEFGNDPLWLSRYYETYVVHDVMRPILLALPEGVCERAHPYLQTPAIRNSLFYREFLAPQGIIDNLVVNLIKRPGINAHLALVRVAPAQPYQADDCARLSALVPHLRRAVYIQSHLVRAADHGAGISAFAGPGSHFLLLHSGCTIADIDPTLALLLRLRPGDALGDGPLGRAVAQAIAGGEPVAIELVPDDGEPLPLLLEARGLEPNRFGDLAAGPAPSHAVHIARLNVPRAIAYDAMGALYRLTPTERAVLRDAITHSDLAGIGGRLGMAQATARTHLHRVYEKTGTRSFAALSNLAHRFVRLAGPRSVAKRAER